MPKWRNRPVHLNIYGKGDDEDRLRIMLSDNDVKNITIHGYTNNVLKVWEKNHIIFMPSFMEGLPIALIGAIFCGRVPVVTDIGAHCEVIEDNKTGFIAKKPEVLDLDEALERAYSNLSRLEGIGKMGREKVLNLIPEDPVDDFIKKLLKI